MPASRCVSALAIVLGLSWCFVAAAQGGKGGLKTQAARAQNTAIRPAPSVPPLDLQCGEIVRVTGVKELPPANTAVEPAANDTVINPPPNDTAGIPAANDSRPAAVPEPKLSFSIKMPPCPEKAEKPTDLVFHLVKDGQLELVAATPFDSPRPFPYSKVGFVLLAAMIILLALTYVAYSSFLIPEVKKITSRIIEARVYEIGQDTSRTQLERSAAAQNLAVNSARQITNEFHRNDFKTLQDRVADLERQKTNAAGQIASPNRETTPMISSAPPIVTAPQTTAHDQFIGDYNMARSDPSSRPAFLQRYKPKPLQVTNTTEVTRSNIVPLFDWKDDGDLLVISVNNIEKDGPWPQDHFYLVPGYDKRWVNDRITGGCWNFFFQINKGKGVTALIEPAIVKQSANSWELADEGEQGEIAWDPNASV